jgi:hypothetical protein
MSEQKSQRKRKRVEPPTAAELAEQKVQTDHKTAKSLYDKKEYNNALTLYQELVSKTPNHILAENWYYRIGNCLFEQEKYQEAIQAYNKSIEIKASAAKYGMRAEAYTNCREYVKTIADCNLALNFSISRPEMIYSIYHLRGHAFLMIQMYEQSKKDYEKALMGLTEESELVRCKDKLLEIDRLIIQKQELERKKPDVPVPVTAPVSTRLTIPPIQWTKEQVAEWLKDIGFAYHHYSFMFEENSVTGKILSQITKDELKDLGVTNSIHLSRIQDGIQTLFAPASATAHSSTAAATNAIPQSSTLTNAHVLSNVSTINTDKPTERKTCVVCLDREKCIRLDPCGHVAFCETCNRNTSITTCPLCRLLIEKRQMTYY